MSLRPPSRSPAAYLEDVRAALAVEIAHSSDALKDDPAELASSARILRKDMQLLDQLVDAVGDIELTAEHDGVSAPLVEMLEAMCRLLSDRLDDVAYYGPMPMGDVLDLATRLRWAAEEAIRMEPGLEHRLTASEWRRMRAERKAGR